MPLAFHGGQIIELSTSQIGCTPPPGLQVYARGRRALREKPISNRSSSCFRSEITRWIFNTYVQDTEYRSSANHRSNTCPDCLASLPFPMFHLSRYRCWRCMCSERGSRDWASHCFFPNKTGLAALAWLSGVWAQQQGRYVVCFYLADYFLAGCISWQRQRRLNLLWAV
ncbi:hypothetical protein BJY01DRAFT_81565 [Aspergillus pseudoustus]|uniref:FYVE zinc finger domain-containing protein n=1 Tax=Aspergillus pseudoustus TaxID=1810923 RepID=A0ABR4J3X3_9EURO